MSKVQKSRSVWIDEKGLGEIKKRMAELEKPERRNPREKNCWTVDDLARQAYIGRSTVIRLLNKKVPIDEGSAISILGTLGFEPLDFIAKHDRKLQTSNQVPMLNTVIDWQLVCQEMLQEQQEEQRFRRRATEQGFELKVYVPLGLVERKEQQRRTGILPMDLVHQLKEEVITHIYQHDEFLNDVIGQQSVGKNKHIAIVGEAGAGKTTLLDNIATYIQKNTENLPICISLASLQGRTLKNYILEEWLPEAISLTYPEIDIETFHEKSLQKRLRQGGVWLLLDGVDEMGEINTLEKIQSQLSDWLGKVRVVLTCRTNVWDAKTNNPLTGFDTYKTQNFSQGDVRRFIKQWFGFAGKPQLGKVLREKLNEPQSDRIRQLVENPLRLALLCQVFNRDEKAELPETKAGLYELFVRYFYEWKPMLSSVDWTTQLGLKEELHQALGRLSIAGLDSDARFRLPESLIKKELDDRLFKLAWELGWLNLVDREAKRDDEPVYAFFHPTFQEYFAALAIDDWHFFLNHIPENPNHGKYRIFAPEWKEVILLWIGHTNKNKEQFISALIDFNDGCGSNNFFGYKAYFLAALAISEFPDSNCADQIIEKVFELGFSNRNGELLYLIRDTAREVIEQTDRVRAISLLTKIITEAEEHLVIWGDQCFHIRENADNTHEAVWILAKLDPGNYLAQNLLENLIGFFTALNISLGMTQQEAISAANSLVKNLPFEGKPIKIQFEVEPDSWDIINSLNELINSDTIKNNYHYNEAHLAKSLVNLLCNSEDKAGCRQAASTFTKIVRKGMFPVVVAGLKYYLETKPDEYDLVKYLYCSEVIWHCAENMSYPDFYRAWHSQPSTNCPEAPDNIPVGKSSITQNLNFTQLPSILDSAIASDEELNKAVKLICIDGSYFSDPHNPATDIYIEMVEQGCPEKQEEPNTMLQLKKYWRLDLRNLEKRVALLFYNSKNDRTLNPSFLSDISTFGGTIAIISDENCNNVRRISPNAPNLIDTVLKWLRREISES